MENIAYIMKNSGHTYYDIMKMPYAVVLSMVKHFRLQELLQIPEWREEYYKQKYINGLKEGKIKKQTKCDINALRAFGGSL